MELIKYTVGSEKNEVYRAIEESIPEDDKYLRMRLEGGMLDVCEDIFFVAIENGRVISRLWMCYPRHEKAIANWGAFCTVEEYRGRGVGTKVLELCFDEIKKLENPPAGLFCTAGKLWLAEMYGKYGFVPALKGASYGYLYCPLGDSPKTFQEFCEEYFAPAESLRAVPATFEWRNEIDCLLRFAMADIGHDYTVSGKGDIYNMLLNENERKIQAILTEKNRCVGWMLDGNSKIYPLNNLQNLEIG